MAYLQPNYPNISKGYRREPLQRSYRCMKQMMAGSRISWKRAGHNVRNGEKKTGTWKRGYGFVLQCCSSSSSSSTSSPGEVDLVEKDGNFGDRKGQNGYLVSEYGWRVRRMFEEESEMRKVAQVQAEAFHVPMIFFNDLFFDFFQAEVLSGLVYRLRNSPPDRYACLVAEGATSEAPDHRPCQEQIVGVVDVTALRDGPVLQHLHGADEYLYVSGIAVLNNFRRQKVATALLKACDMLSALWGFQYLVLRAYEDDFRARKLYTNAGYKIVSADPPFMTTWIGQKRRLLMIKPTNLF